MLRSIIFSHNLKIYKNKLYMLNVEDELAVELIPIDIWTDLTNKYLTVDFQDYTIPNMLKWYYGSNYKLLPHNDEIDINYYGMGIISEDLRRAEGKYRIIVPGRTDLNNPILLALTQDSAGAYQKCDIRWLFYNTEEPVTKAIVLWSQDSAFVMFVTNLEIIKSNPNLAFICSLLFQKYLADQGAKEIYRLLPKREDYWIWLCTDRDQLGYSPLKNNTSSLEIKREEVGNAYRYSMTGDYLTHLTPAYLKRLFNV